MNLTAVLFSTSKTLLLILLPLKIFGFRLEKDLFLLPQVAPSWAAFKMKNQIMSEDKPRVYPSQDRRVTWEGCSVLLDINDGDRLVFARLNQGS